MHRRCLYLAMGCAIVLGMISTLQLHIKPFTVLTNFYKTESENSIYSHSKRELKSLIANLFRNVFTSGIAAVSDDFKQVKSHNRHQHEITAASHRSAFKSNQLFEQPIILRKPRPRGQLPKKNVIPYQEGIPRVDENRFASIRIDPLQRKINARLTVEIYCPPYTAPSNGSVIYQGQIYRGSTAVPPSVRKVWHPFGDDTVVPIAAAGDIKAGERVQISCDEHFHLTASGSASPICLRSGEFELGKQCSPNMCASYKPPAHGFVEPKGRVMAGDKVKIGCFPPYALDFEDERMQLVKSDRPACLDNGMFELGATCKRKGVAVIRPPPPPPPPVVKQPTYSPFVPEFPPTTLCPAYVAPRHGKVWYQNVEHSISTPADIPQGGRVTLTCDQHYRLSSAGRREPECLHGSRWDEGKTCVPIMCPPYQPPRHGTVDIEEGVMAGTRVTITCDQYHVPVGFAEGARESPLCLDDGTFDKGVTCAPRPCPHHAASLPLDEGCSASARRRHAEARAKAVVVSRRKERRWEEELRHGGAWDYVGNVFDQEPRPTGWDT